jgi:hypothetical protein
MERTRTWLVAAAVAGLAAIAVVDAVVGGGEGQRRAARPTTASESASEEDRLAAEALRAQSAYGTLVYADSECVVHALRLPDVGRLERDTDPPTGQQGCRFTMSPGGSFFVGLAAPRPGSSLIAACAGGEVVVGTDDGIVVGRAPGCAPAWKPNGDLTAVLRGELVDVRFAPPLGTATAPARVLLSKRDLERAFGPPWAFRAPEVREAAWLDNERVAVIVSDAATGEDALAVFEGGRLIGGPPSPYLLLSRLRPSPRGSYVVAQVGEPGGAVVIDRNGEFFALPFRGARAVAWSPDEVWTAAATSNAIYVWETMERPSRFARLPIVARDVAWR